MQNNLRPRQAGINAASGVGYLILQGAASLIVTPFLVNRLGVGAYGLIPLSAAVVNYMSVFSVGLQMAISRHVTIQLARGSSDDVSGVFSTSLVMVFIAGTVIVMLSALVATHVESLFHIQPSLAVAARVYLLLNALYYSLTLVSACIGSIGYAHGRVDLQNGIRVVDLILRTLLPVGALLVLKPDVRWVGAGLLLASVWSLGANTFLWRRMAPGVRFRLRTVSRPVLARLCRTSGWGTLNQAGSLLHLSTDVAVLSVAIGTASAGVYGALMQWVVFIRSAISAISAGAAPMITHSVGREDYDSAWSATVTLIRLCGALAAVGAAIVGGSSDVLLGAWLGPAYERYGVVLAVLMAALPLNLAVVPLFTTQTATDRVRGPALVTLWTGLLNLGISIVLVRMEPLGLGVSIGTLIALSAKNMFYTPIHSARVMMQDARQVYRVFPGVLMLTGISFAVTRVGITVMGVSGLLGLAGVASISVLISAPLAWWFVLDNSSRDRLRRLMPSPASVGPR